MITSPSLVPFVLLHQTGFTSLATTLAALNTIVVYSWTVTIEQPDKLVVLVCTSELELHQYEDTKEFT